MSNAQTLNQLLGTALSRTDLQLTEQDAELLKVIVQTGLTRGSSAMRKARLNPEQMLVSARKLVEYGLVAAEGETSDDVMIQYAMFSPNARFLPVVARGLNIQMAL